MNRCSDEICTPDGELPDGHLPTEPDAEGAGRPRPLPPGYWIPCAWCEQQTWHVLDTYYHTLRCVRCLAKDGITEDEWIAGRRIAALRIQIAERALEMDEMMTELSLMEELLCQLQKQPKKVEPMDPGPSVGSPA